ncbi:MAG: phospholipid/cholesterol/gamma-HCH transport system substrate-binding protein [Solirubrobacteraceae bacterium]|jgi:virulence factor Mce-like protein|nr:phospholipid/cholesterol/gamma-HCH transport system substrate-binding protein [Solirubrobacteraceae bacterium]
MDPRNRLSHGVNRKRLKQEAVRSARPTAMFVVGIVIAIGIAAWLLINISNVFGRKTYDVRFKVDNAFGIFEGFDDVRFRGVPAGTIEKIERDGTQMIVLARIQKKYGPVYNDAHAELRPVTPLNDIYLDISDPGHPSAGKVEADKPLAESQTTTSVTVPDVLDGLTVDARTNAYRLLDNLGNGLADRGLKLRQSFVELAPLLTQAGQLADQIALHKTQTARLVHNTGILTDELARRETDLKRLISTGALTLGTLQQGRGDLDATLRELGPTFTELQASLASVRGIVDDVDGGLQSLYPVAEKLPSGLKDLRELGNVLAPAAKALTPAITKFYGWTVPVTGFLEQGNDIAEAFNQGPTVSALNRTATDLVACKQGVIGFFQWNASLSKFGDKTGGPIPRGNLAIGAPAPTGPPLRDPVQSCTPGYPARGVPTLSDEH